jgi:hypothetical protein
VRVARRAGIPFDVMVTTCGGGCIEEADTEVEVQGALAVVRPYQASCTTTSAPPIC